ncbi:MAG TPA: helix-turn-helix domain-containing protein, partial [Bdellovibrionales bacterium]|nr:helix-turn-helix domain-containing protein [Bdellovibrionales bacterium]
MPVTTTPSSAWRRFLNDDLAARKARNSEFSLRSYAKLLALSPGHLSTILSGSRPITPKTALHIAKVLGITPSETVGWLHDTSDSTKPH